MPRPVVTYPDVEEMALADLTEDMTGAFAAEFSEAFDVALADVTVGIVLPDGWTIESPPHVQIALDGTPRDLHPIAQQSTLRIVVWAKYTTVAKPLAQLAHGLLLARHQYSRLTGLLVAPDPKHKAELASFTVRATVRATPIP